jgi:ADP-heptose:LPS heptosyltransferase
MYKLQLPQITLIAVAGNKHGETIAALYKSMSKVDFGAVKLITNIDIVSSGIEVVNVGGLESWGQYNDFIIRELYKYFDTEYCLIVQHDSWVLNPDCWDNAFLDFDIVGAKWLDVGLKYNTSNGGFSLRSKRLQEIIAHDEFIQFTTPEDVVINKLYRDYLEKKYSIRFCDEAIADKFAFELVEPLHKTFGFHGYHHQPFKKHIILKRTGAMGDVLMLEPVIDYYCKKDYQVVLDTQAHYMELFNFYPYIIKHISQMDKRIKPVKIINFDMAYENNPKQLALKSYVEVAGINDLVYRNSKLHFQLTQDEKLFTDKYVVLHIDDTAMPQRNIHGVEWGKVKKYLQKKGYHVFQVGRCDHEKVGTYINTPALSTLMYVLKGADLFIGNDSGVGQMAVALGVNAVFFFGSVRASYRYQDFTKINIVNRKCPDYEKRFCYHNFIGSVTGGDCEFDKELPPCTQYSAEQVIESIKKFI